MKTTISILLKLCFPLLLAPQAEATIKSRNWERIQIPDAVCGNGLPYSVLIEKNKASRLVVEFMGGGACWSADTCYGPNLRGLMFLFPTAPAYSYVSYKDSFADLKDHTYLYFPYCTGDVHIGRHTGHYALGIKAHHEGYNNVIKALDYLQQQGILDFKRVKDFVSWGASAGAIGSLAHTVTFDKYLSPSANKTVIADAPGLHFGKEFWDKFDSDFLKDFSEQFANVGLNFDTHDGFVAQYMGPYFEKNKHWNIGIMQGTRDIIMSSVFGDIDPYKHERLVLGPKGIVNQALPYNNVETWIQYSPMHTYLLIKPSAELTDMKGESAKQFFQRIHAKVFNP